MFQISLRPKWLATVSDTKSAQVVDSLDGVNALYRPGSGDGSDTTYSCAAYAKRYFSSRYGVTVYNLLQYRTPLVSSGKLTVVTTPQKGDLAFWRNRPHSAIAKYLSGSTVVLIEQNWKWLQNGSWVTYKERTVSKYDSQIKFYRWSR